MKRLALAVVVFVGAVAAVAAGALLAAYVFLRFVLVA